MSGQAYRKRRASSPCSQEHALWLIVRQFFRRCCGSCILTLSRKPRIDEPRPYLFGTEVVTQTLAFSKIRTSRLYLGWRVSWGSLGGSK